MNMMQSAWQFMVRMYGRLKFLFKEPADFTCGAFATLCKKHTGDLSNRLFDKPIKVLVLYSHEVPFHVFMVGALTEYARQHTVANEFSLKIVDVDTFFDDQLRAAVLKSKYDGTDIILSMGFVLPSFLMQVLLEIGGCPSIVLGMRAPKAIGLHNRGTLNLTGIVREPDADTDCAHYVALLRPYINSVLIPYWPLGDGGYLPTKTAHISQYLSSQGLQVFTVPVDTVNDLMQALNNYHSQVKAVLFLEGCLAAEALVLARDFCWKNKILLCFSESLYAIRYGVPFVYGSDFSRFASEAFCLMRMQRESGLSLGDMPLVHIPNDRELVINEAYFLQLGLPRKALDVFRGKSKVRIIKVCAQE